MTPVRLAEIKARLEAATPGRPWSCNAKTGTIYAPDVIGVVEIGEIGAFRDRALLPFNKDRWLGDLALLTTAPTDIADLLAEVERLRELIRSVTPAIQALADDQRQIDENGVMVGVSRQAVDEVVTAMRYMQATEEPRP